MVQNECHIMQMEETLNRLRVHEEFFALVHGAGLAFKRHCPNRVDIG